MIYRMFKAFLMVLVAVTFSGLSAAANSEITYQDDAIQINLIEVSEHAKLYQISERSSGAVINYIAVNGRISITFKPHSVFRNTYDPATPGMYATPWGGDHLKIVVDNKYYTIYAIIDRDGNVLGWVYHDKIKDRYQMLH